MTPYHFFYVYILRSVKYISELYIGFMSDIKRRLLQHNNGKGQSTKRYMPWELFYYEAFSDESSARKRELSLKNNGNPMRELKKRIGISSGKKSDKGFTLMETLVYIALFGILMSGAIVGAYNLMEGGDRNIAAIRVQEEGTFLNRKINWALAGATSASVSADGSILTLVRPDLGAQSPLVISGSASSMIISRGVGAPVKLNSDRFLINNVAFTYLASVNGRPPSVLVNYLVQNKPFSFRGYIRQ